MTNALLSSVSSTLNLSTRQEIAKLLGESESAVSKGLELATSAAFAGLNRQADQSETMRQVTAELEKLGIAPDRYGEEHPVGDNATEAGRAQNRRISMLVTQK
jgi:predicted transcriptional regulator